MPDSAPDRIRHRGCVLLVYQSSSRRDWRVALYRDGTKIGSSNPISENGHDVDARRATEVAEKVADLLWPEARVVLREGT